MSVSAGSGGDPMAERSRAADTAHVMKTATRYDQHAAQARGRFGRDVRPAPAADDVPMDDARTQMHTDRAGERFDTALYVVDADAVAAAIVHRLIAGRTIAPR
jgi:hypothetical protein